MSEQIPDFAPLSPEQLAALSEKQKEIFRALDEADRQFFAQNFSPQSLGKALERKGETIQSRQRMNEFDQRVKERVAAAASASQPGITAGEVAVGAAGVAGLVGIGALAGKIAPQGKASWRGVTPRDLVDPLVRVFSRQEKTDLQFNPPMPEGVLRAAVLLRTSSGLLPGLTILLTPLGEGTQVEISKVSSESLLDVIRQGGQKLVDLVQDGLRMGRRGGAGSLLDLAGSLLDKGIDIAQMVKDLDLEDKAWEAIQQAAEPLQAIYDEKMKVEREQRLKLEMVWDDYYSCPKCRVEFGAGDVECRVCGMERPPQPDQPDPRKRFPS